MKESNSDNSVITIDHVLHGYQSGHSLIASSIDLSADAKRALLVMSDMSGQSMMTGFEEYITGYPIKDVNSYAIAKTWYAPEMKRPGCVWTHTILIRFSDLVQVYNSEDILFVFRRPENEPDYEYYNKPLEIRTSKKEKSFNERFERTPFVERLINFLYNSNDRYILIHEENSKIFEKLIIALWLQQWPRLKRNFSFCTGSISPRLFNGEPLDLQVIPHTDSSIMSNKNYIVVDPTLEINSTSELWSKLICEDLFEPSSLRKYLRTFGADVKPKRTSFKSLVKVFNFSRNVNRPSLKEILSVLAEEFPAADEALSLKNAILTSERKTAEIPPSFSEDDILYELATSQNYSAFDAQKLSIKQRIDNLYASDPSRVFDLFNRIIKCDVNSLGEEVLKEIANHVDDSKIELLNKSNRDLVPLFSVLNPDLAYQVNFWKVPREQQKERFNFLIKNNRDKIDWHKIMSIVFDHELEVEHEIIESDEINAVEYVLNWYNSEKGSSLNNVWTNMLSSKSAEVLSWLSENKQLNNRVLKLVIEILNPNSQDVVKNGTLIWIQLSENNKIENDRNLDLDFKSFVLVVALNVQDDSSFPLFVYSVETVYRSLLDNNLSYYSWKHIERHTPQLGLWSDWNKAKKLMIAIVEIFVRNKWMSDDFYNLFKDRRTLEQAIYHYKN